MTHIFYIVLWSFWGLNGIIQNMLYLFIYPKYVENELKDRSGAQKWASLLYSILLIIFAHAFVVHYNVFQYTLRVFLEFFFNSDVHWLTVVHVNRNSPLKTHYLPFWILRFVSIWKGGDFISETFKMILNFQRIPVPYTVVDFF